MQIQVNTDHNIHGAVDLAESIREELERNLKRFDEHLTRVEVHISDKNSDKRGGGDDIRCLMEARLEGREPNVVSHDGANLKQAITGAESKLVRQLDKILERQRNH